VANSATAFLGSGPAFPFAPVGGTMPIHADEQKIRESIWLILATAPGERVMRPDFGCGIHDLLFAVNTPPTRAAAVARVKTALVRWEPRIDVLAVSATAPDGSANLADQRNILLVTIDYRIRANNAVFNLVYPFYLDEGAGA